MARDRLKELRRRIYLVLEAGPVGDRFSVLVDRLLVALILINLVAVALESVPAIDARYALLFNLIEVVSLVVFTVEYGLRLWCAVEHGPNRHLSPARARLKYALSPAGLVDLVAVLPFWFALVLPADLRVVLVFRIVRFFKIARYSPAMRSLLDVLYRERRALFGCLVITLGAALVAAALMHLAEGKVQPDKLGTIPDALWWAIVTLGTIGYGDVVPVTALGKLIATGTIFLGLIMIALPVGIIATAFAEQIHRRDFVVTWGMIARVPLFAELDAAEISDIMELLRAQVVEAGAGDRARAATPAHSMYFIAAGEVEIALKGERLRLGAGQFFGEVAVLRRARRSATVTALARTSLLVLDAQDLHALMQRDPRIAERIKDVVEKRVGRELVSPKGDIVRGGDRVGVPAPAQAGRANSRHRLLQVLVDLVEEAGGRQPLLVGADEEREVLGHEAGFDRVDADLLQRARELRQLGVAVELGAMGEAARPGEDRGDRVGRGLLALLVLAVVARDGAVRGFGLHHLAVRRHQHRGHQAERAEALRHGVGLHVAVVVLAGPDIAARPLQRRRHHVVDQPVLVGELLGGELVLELLVEDLLEDVLEAAVIGLEDGVLGRQIDRIAARQAVIERGACEVADRVVEIVHRHARRRGPGT